MESHIRTIHQQLINREITCTKLVQERLELLKPKERIELLIKLMPFVFPKITSVSHTTNEPLDWG